MPRAIFASLFVLLTASEVFAESATNPESPTAINSPYPSGLNNSPPCQFSTTVTVPKSQPITGPITPYLMVYTGVPNAGSTNQSFCDASSYQFYNLTQTGPVAVGSDSYAYTFSGMVSWSTNAYPQAYYFQIAYYGPSVVSGTGTATYIWGSQNFVGQPAGL